MSPIFWSKPVLSDRRIIETLPKTIRNSKKKGGEWKISTNKRKGEGENYRELLKHSTGEFFPRVSGPLSFSLIFFSTDSGDGWRLTRTRCWLQRRTEGTDDRSDCRLSGVAEAEPRNNRAVEGSDVSDTWQSWQLLVLLAHLSSPSRPSPSRDDSASPNVISLGQSI